MDESTKKIQDAIKDKVAEAARNEDLLNLNELESVEGGGCFACKNGCLWSGMNEAAE